MPMSYYEEDIKTHKKLDRSFAMNLPVDVQRAAPISSDRRMAAPMRSKVPYSRLEGRVVPDMVRGGELVLLHFIFCLLWCVPVLIIGINFEYCSSTTERRFSKPSQLQW